MKRFKFVMVQGYTIDILAVDFRSACVRFEAFGVDPKKIVEIQEKS